MKTSKTKPADARLPQEEVRGLAEDIASDLRCISNESIRQTRIAQLKAIVDSHDRHLKEEARWRTALAQHRRRK